MKFQPKYGTIDYEVKDEIAYAILNRPENLNAFNGEMHWDMAETWREINRDPDVRVVIISGRGRALSVGADMKEESSGQRDGGTGADRRLPMLDWVGSYHHKEYEGLTAWGQPRRVNGLLAKPVITAVNGICCGGGLNFVFFSDIVICSDDAQFFDPHVDVSIAPCGETMGMVRLRSAPRGVALRIAFMGKRYRVDAERALQLGIVTEIVPRDQLLERATELAGHVKEASPAALQAIVAAFWDTVSLPYDQARYWGQAYALQVRNMADGREGPIAWAEGRAPVWTGYP